MTLAPPPPGFNPTGRSPMGQQQITRFDRYMAGMPVEVQAALKQREEEDRARILAILTQGNMPQPSPADILAPTPQGVPQMGSPGAWASRTGEELQRTFEHGRNPVGLDDFFGAVEHPARVFGTLGLQGLAQGPGIPGLRRENPADMARMVRQQVGGTSAGLPHEQVTPVVGPDGRMRFEPYGASARTANIDQYHGANPQPWGARGTSELVFDPLNVIPVPIVDDLLGAAMKGVPAVARGLDRGLGRAVGAAGDFVTDALGRAAPYLDPTMGGLAQPPARPTAAGRRPPSTPSESGGMPTPDEPMRSGLGDDKPYREVLAESIANLEADVQRMTAGGEVNNAEAIREATETLQARRAELAALDAQAAPAAPAQDMPDPQTPVRLDVLEFTTAMTPRELRARAEQMGATVTPLEHTGTIPYEAAEAIIRAIPGNRDDILENIRQRAMIDQRRAAATAPAAPEQAAPAAAAPEQAGQDTAAAMDALQWQWGRDGRDTDVIFDARRNPAIYLDGLATNTPNALWLVRMDGRQPAKLKRAFLQVMKDSQDPNADLMSRGPRDDVKTTYFRSEAEARAWLDQAVAKLGSRPVSEAQAASAGAGQPLPERGDMVGWGRRTVAQDEQELQNAIDRGASRSTISRLRKKLQRHQELLDMSIAEEAAAAPATPAAPAQAAPAAPDTPPATPSPEERLASRSDAELRSEERQFRQVVKNFENSTSPFAREQLEKFRVQLQEIQDEIARRQAGPQQSLADTPTDALLRQKEGLDTERRALHREGGAKARMGEIDSEMAAIDAEIARRTAAPAAPAAPDVPPSTPDAPTGGARSFEQIMAELPQHPGSKPAWKRKPRTVDELDDRLAEIEDVIGDIEGELDEATADSVITKLERRLARATDYQEAMENAKVELDEAEYDAGLGDDLPTESAAGGGAPPPETPPTDTTPSPERSGDGVMAVLRNPDYANMTDEQLLDEAKNLRYQLYWRNSTEFTDDQIREMLGRLDREQKSRFVRADDLPGEAALRLTTNDIHFTDAPEGSPQWWEQVDRRVEAILTGKLRSRWTNLQGPYSRSEYADPFSGKPGEITPHEAATRLLSDLDPASPAANRLRDALQAIEDRLIGLDKHPRHFHGEDMVQLLGGGGGELFDELLDAYRGGRAGHAPTGGQPPDAPHTGSTRWPEDEVEGIESMSDEALAQEEQALDEYLRSIPPQEQMRLRVRSTNLATERIHRENDAVTRRVLADIGDGMKGIEELRAAFRDIPPIKLDEQLELMKASKLLEEVAGRRFRRHPDIDKGRRTRFLHIRRPEDLGPAYQETLRLQAEQGIIPAEDGVLSRYSPPDAPTGGQPPTPTPDAPTGGAPNRVGDDEFHVRSHPGFKGIMDAVVPGPFAHWSTPQTPGAARRRIEEVQDWLNEEGMQAHPDDRRTAEAHLDSVKAAVSLMDAQADRLRAEEMDIRAAREQARLDKDAATQAQRAADTFPQDVRDYVVNALRTGQGGRDTYKSGNEGITSRDLGQLDPRALINKMVTEIQGADADTQVLEAVRSLYEAWGLAIQRAMVTRRRTRPFETIDKIPQATRDLLADFGGSIVDLWVSEKRAGRATGRDIYSGMLSAINSGGRAPSEFAWIPPRPETPPQTRAAEDVPDVQVNEGTLLDPAAYNRTQEELQELAAEMPTEDDELREIIRQSVEWSLRRSAEWEASRVPVEITPTEEQELLALIDEAVAPSIAQARRGLFDLSRRNALVPVPGTARTIGHPGYDVVRSGKEWRIPPGKGGVYVGQVLEDNLRKSMEGENALMRERMMAVAKQAYRRIMAKNRNRRTMRMEAVRHAVAAARGFQIRLQEGLAIPQQLENLSGTFKDAGIGGGGRGNRRDRFVSAAASGGWQRVYKYDVPKMAKIDEVLQAAHTRDGLRNIANTLMNARQLQWFVRALGGKAAGLGTSAQPFEFTVKVGFEIVREMMTRNLRGNVTATMTKYGPPIDLFGPMNEKGVLTGGVFEGRNLDINTLAEHVELRPDGTPFSERFGDILTPEQLNYLNDYFLLQDGIRNYAVANGLKIPKRKVGEGAKRFLPIRVARGPDGELAYIGNPYDTDPDPSRTIGRERQRTFDTAEQAGESGFVLQPPQDAILGHIDDISRRLASLELHRYLKEHTGSFKRAELRFADPRLDEETGHLLPAGRNALRVSLPGKKGPVLQDMIVSGQDADRIMKILYEDLHPSTDFGSNVLRSLTRVNALARLGQTTIDPGFFLIQGLSVAAGSPGTFLGKAGRSLAPGIPRGERKGLSDWMPAFVQALGDHGALRRRMATMLDELHTTGMAQSHPDLFHNMPGMPGQGELPSYDMTAGGALLERGRAGRAFGRATRLPAFATLFDYHMLSWAKGFGELSEKLAMADVEKAARKFRRVNNEAMPEEAKQALYQERVTEIDRAHARALGAFNSKRVGMPDWQSGVERAFMFYAQQWTRSQAAMVANAVMTRDRRSLGIMLRYVAGIGGAIALTKIATAAAQDRNYEETVRDVINSLDVNHPNFGTVTVGGVELALGGKMRQIFRNMMELGLRVPGSEDAYVNTREVAGKVLGSSFMRRMGGFVNIESEMTGPVDLHRPPSVYGTAQGQIARAMTSQASPAFGLAEGAATGEDWEGRNTNPFDIFRLDASGLSRLAASGFLPFWIDGAIQNYLSEVDVYDALVSGDLDRARSGDIGAALTVGGGEFAGVITRNPTAHDIHVQTTGALFNENWYTTEPFLKSWVRDMTWTVTEQSYAERAEDGDEVSATTVQRKATLNRRAGRVQNLARGAMSGAVNKAAMYYQWRDIEDDQGESVRATYDMLRAMQGERETDRELTDEELALDGYTQRLGVLIEATETRYEEGGEERYQKASVELNQYEARMKAENPIAYQYMLRNTHMYDQMPWPLFENLAAYATHQKEGHPARLQLTKLLHAYNAKTDWLEERYGREVALQYREYFWMGTYDESYIPLPQGEVEELSIPSFSAQGPQTRASLARLEGR